MTVQQDPRLDRRVQFDDRSKNFPIRELLRATQQPRSYTWSVPIWLDQGREGACVGFAWAHELAARPLSIVGLDAAFAQRIYKQSQRVDQWPGEDYSGTSVIAGAKVVQESLYMSEYRWAFGVDDLRLAVGYKGPAVIGINWYEGMFTPGSDGYIKPTGALAGGHAILVHSNNEKAKRFMVWNSWGSNWGMVGRAYISHEDMARLLAEDGEACIPVTRRKGK